MSKDECQRYASVVNCNIHRRRSDIFGGGSSGETKIAEGISDAKNRRFVLYIAFARKIAGGGAQPPSRLRRP